MSKKIVSSKAKKHNTNKENPMKSKTTAPVKKTVVVRRPRKNHTLNGIPVGVPVNVKVAGERVMRKGVMLEVKDATEGTLVLRTGRRGRPPVLNATDIVKVRAL